MSIALTLALARTSCILSFAAQSSPDAVDLLAEGADEPVVAGERSYACVEDPDRGERYRCLVKCEYADELYLVFKQPISSQPYYLKKCSQQAYRFCERKFDSEVEYSCLGEEY